MLNFLFLQQMNQPITDIKARPWEDGSVNVLTGSLHTFSLVVWNDEVNTFDWVIETLMDICGHSKEQAEQCAMIIHTRGKYAVKHGSYATLNPMREAITERGIDATIEALTIDK